MASSYTKNIKLTEITPVLESAPIY